MAPSPTTDPAASPGRPDSLLRAILRSIRAILKEGYGVTRARIRPVGQGASRFSVPCKVTGTKDGRRITLFIKILGSSDRFTVVASSFLKNMYLQMNDKDALFDIPNSAMEMALYQYEKLQRIHRLRIPTSQALGYHRLDDVRALLVLEWIDALPLSMIEVTAEQADLAFQYLRILHDNKVHHGDIKSDNLMLDRSGTLYLLDTGKFRTGAPVAAKAAYDLASMVCTFAQHLPVSDVVLAARAHHGPARTRKVLDYLDLVVRRPDFYLTGEKVERLHAALRRI